LTQLLSVSVTRRAAAQIIREAAWWQKNRPAAPDAVAVELERCFALLSLKPNLGVLARNARLHGVRRIHLAKIHQHLYYRVVGDTIEVLALWHTSRGKGPGV
jgi:plasmid stabilization system protein ParE